MKLLGPTPFQRLNEAVGFVCLAAALMLLFSLISFSPLDPSWNTASSSTLARNLMGIAGAHIADLLLQLLGLSAFLLPAWILALGWSWAHSREITSSLAKITGAAMMLFGLSSLLSLGPEWRPYSGAIHAGGILGTILAEKLLVAFNPAGSIILAITCLLMSLYLISTFSLQSLPVWITTPVRKFLSWRESLLQWRDESVRRREERAARRAETAARHAAQAALDATNKSGVASDTVPAEPRASRRARTEIVAVAEGLDSEIPIRTLDDAELEPAAVEPEPMGAHAPPWEGPKVVELVPPPPPQLAPRPIQAARTATRGDYRLPATDLLNEGEGRPPYDAVELKDIAASIKSKFEEFNVLGNVVQINPGPVVTTFEYKPEAGIKYSRITTLNEDLCLGLQAESVLIERIPGKPTVGIEVPNTRREVINLRQVLESEEFQHSPSKLTISLGKDISGRIRVTSLEAMPHLLIAGSTGSGKSVMLNSLIMSVLYKSTPDDVRMILIDPKRVEMGMYEGIPHLLTPVITDPRKATNALHNAVLEMERRLKLLASQGVRNIEQFNRKVRQKLAQPRSLFEEEQAEEEELQPLPFVLLIIDELADLMMIERGNVEESITRLAQMARAVGMHLVVATQRPSVDVITGLIKANFPARISFRVATRVDSRTILDVMGAEHLLGKGDMLFLPPGSSRLTRVHAPYVTESEIAGVVDFWKQQAQPEYDQSFLIAPADEEEAAAEAGEIEGADDPAYEDAVRVVLEVGKASTSILQRRLRLGYGRAARLLDVMQRDGIIGPPDGPRPREVLKRPDWLKEVEDQLH
jgi:S-DNA-T family DNA segregation ATPase FtsK/SpoIIIE